MFFLISVMCLSRVTSCVYYFSISSIYAPTLQEDLSPCPLPMTYSTSFVGRVGSIWFALVITHKQTWCTPCPSLKSHCIFLPTLLPFSFVMREKHVPDRACSFSMHPGREEMQRRPEIDLQLPIVMWVRINYCCCKPLEFGSGLLSHCNLVISGEMCES